MQWDPVTSRYTVLSPGAVDEPVVETLEVRRSRFHAHLLRLEDEESAREFVAGLRRQYHDARHWCSAFVLGADRMTMRSSDDGEPAGTAGIPMLEAITQRETGAGRRDLSDVCAVVVRYFGGVKLGAGGLVRAYSEAVSSVLDTATLRTRQRMLITTVVAPLTEAGRWENEVRAAGFHVRDTSYRARSALLHVAVPDDGEAPDRFEHRLAAITGGAGTAEPAGVMWVDLDA